MSGNQNKLIIGSEEWCAFPTLGIPAIKARVDSGAKTSSIHAFNIQTFKRNGESWVSFEVHPIQDNRSIATRCEYPVTDRRVVKSSSGIGEKRYVIRVPLEIGDFRDEAELTLTNRDSMGYRMLLGREAMHNKMLVDPSAHFNLGNRTKEDIQKFYGASETLKSGLKIGLLASNPDLYSNKRIIEAGRERGHEMIFLGIKHCYMKLDADAPEVHFSGGALVNDLDAVITRIKPAITFYGCALARQFESMGVKTINTSAAITQSRDKLYSLQLLLQNGLNIPTTSCASSSMETIDLIEMVNGAPLIIKSLEGAQGHNVVLAESKKAAESAINAFKSLHANLLVQEFIKEAQGKNIRCFVIDGKVVATIETKAAAGEFRAKLQRGGVASVVKVTSEEKRLAIRAAKILGLSVAGIDIIRSEKGPLLLDIDPSPGLEGIETTTGKNIAGLIITSIEKYLGWKMALTSSLKV